MLFNSMDFLLFFTAVVMLYYILPHKFRWMLLLTSSYIFYMAWRPELILLILFSTFVNYFVSLRIHKIQNKVIKRRWLIFSMVVNFGLLFIFKYMMFINHTFMGLYQSLGWEYPIGEFNIILPMGISFYTFQAASYTIDIYRGNYKPERNFFKFSLFVTFFPQLVAGPIERADRLLGQLFTKKKFNTDNISMGIKYMILGYFKKVVIADRAAILVNTVYNSPNDFEGLAFIIATLFFTVQIYCDFSGYSDIAKGCAKLLGIDLMQNFNRPYFSKSIKEFWRRWHISLSTWFKDYLYIPLGGSRVSKPRYYFNLMATFTVSGLWHGANWTFVLWGMLHGAYQVIGDIKNSIFGRFKVKFILFDWISMIITFVLVAFAWILFRANNISDGIYIIRNLTSGLSNITNYQYLYELFNSMGLQMFEILLVLGSILILIFMEMISYKYEITFLMSKAPVILRFIFYYVLMIIILGSGVLSSGGEFIYFQF